MAKDKGQGAHVPPTVEPRVVDNASEVFGEGVPMGSRPQAQPGLIAVGHAEMRSLVAAIPRNIPQVRAMIEETISEFPEAAHKVRYLKPVGRDPDICLKCGAQNFRPQGQKKPNKECYKQECRGPLKEGPQVFASDISVAAADWMVQVLGGISSRATVEPTADPAVVMIRCIVTDYHTGTQLEDARLVSRMAKNKQGATYMLDETRFMEQVVPAQQSKLRRNVSLRLVPMPVKQFMLDRADAATQDHLSPDVVDKIIKTFEGEWKITLHQIELFLMKPKKDWNNADRLRLQQCYNGLKDGAQAPSDFFPDLESFGDEVPGSAAEKPPEEPKSNRRTVKTGGASTADALMGAGASVVGQRPQEPAEKGTQAAGPVADQAKPAEPAGGKQAATGTTLDMIPYKFTGIAKTLADEIVVVDDPEYIAFMRDQVTYQLRDSGISQEEATELERLIQYHSLSMKTRK